MTETVHDRARARRAAAPPGTAPRGPGSPAGGEQPAGLERSATRVRGFDEAELDFQLLRQMGAAAHGGASVGECLAVAAEVGDGGPRAWCASFSALGERQAGDAAERARRGHAVSARDQYLRASNSFRAVEYFTPFSDPDHRAAGLRSREMFVAAMAAADCTFEEVWVPFGDASLPAYWFTPAGPSGQGPGPLLVAVSGFDGTLEETWLQVGRPAIDRGYRVLLVAGPGQMDTMRFHPALTFRPDYEAVIGPALDGALARPEVDPARVALLGMSFGGYFATRAAAHEPRLAALVADSPIVDLHAYMTSFVGFDPSELPAEADFGIADIPAIPDSELPPEKKEMAASMITRFGAPSFAATYRYLKEFRVDGADLAGISCPSLALVGEGEGGEPLRQADVFAGSVSGPSARYVFTGAEGADSHCQVGNLGLAAAVIFDWLDEVPA